MRKYSMLFLLCLPLLQTNPNATRQDNWSSRGNINPYTGQSGTKNPYP